MGIFISTGIFSPLKKSTKSQMFPECSDRCHRSPSEDESLSKAGWELVTLNSGRGPRRAAELT